MDSIDQSSLITELLAQQDAVIEQLDGLIEQIEAVLKSAVVSVGRDEPSEESAGAPSSFNGGLPVANVTDRQSTPRAKAA